MVKYSRQPAVETKSAKTKVADLRAHFKNTYETARAVKGLKLKRAIKYLEDVLEHRDCIPYRRFTGHVGRTTQAKLHGVTQGRFPEKSVRYIIQLLKNLQANAEFIATEKAEGVKRAEKVAPRLTKKQAAKQRLAIGK
ncbi:hypothetical protein FGO68_gene3052 [Halteria grandinella]|uniref:60S ribosomal protein L17 n=1 Tax=Halteria grandinella TaxID=5974 RepID=A0A8J8NIH9_HALGN|nr:hypothetical protein FGO68_gene3052 [Halteria grandinella]